MNNCHLGEAKFALWRELVRQHFGLPADDQDATKLEGLVQLPVVASPSASTPAPAPASTSAPPPAQATEDNNDENNNDGDDEDIETASTSSGTSPIRVVVLPLRQLLRSDIDLRKLDGILNNAQQVYNSLCDEAQFVAKLLFDWVRSELPRTSFVK